MYSDGARIPRFGCLQGEQKFREELTKQREARQALFDAERKEEEEERRREEEGPSEAPFEHEISACEALLAYLKQAAEVKTERAVKTDKLDAGLMSFQGLAVMKKEEEDMFSAVQSKVRGERWRGGEGRGGEGRRGERSGKGRGVGRGEEWIGKRRGEERSNVQCACFCDMI